MNVQQSLLISALTITLILQVHLSVFKRTTILATEPSDVQGGGGGCHPVKGF